MKWIKNFLTTAAIGLGLHAFGAGEIEALHEDIWKRLIQPNGLLLDYNTPEGDVAYPSPEECLQGKPNAVSWWTPIENGAFFTGLYMDAVVRRFQKTGSEADRAKAKRLADGLLLCASVGQTPGFVARGVLSDGKSHYALGSDDQTGPWFYGLWRYVRTGAATGEEKKRVVAKMTEVAEALKKNKWNLPCDPVGTMKAGLNRGSFSAFEYRAATRLLFVTRAMWELTGSKDWEQDYEEALTNEISEKKTKETKTRLELVAEGMPGDFGRNPGLAKNQLWIFVNSQAMVRELLDLETRQAIRQVYQTSLKLNADTAAPAIKAQVPTGLDSPPFVADWRVMNSIWKPQTTSGEATELAMEQLLKVWKNSARQIEIEGLREPFSAACLVFLSPERNASAAERFLKLVSAVHSEIKWNKIYSAYCFYAEVAWYLLSASSPETTKDVSGNPFSGVPVNAEKLQLKSFRSTGKYPIEEVPPEILGKKIITVQRGDIGKPGTGFSYTASRAGTAWLLVMDQKDKQEPGGEWKATGLVVRWNSGNNSFSDRVYRRTVTAGMEIRVPEATALSGKNYSIPHALVLSEGE